MTYMELNHFPRSKSHHTLDHKFTQYHHIKLLTIQPLAVYSGLAVKRHPLSPRKFSTIQPLAGYSGSQVKHNPMSSSLSIDIV